MVSRPFSAFGRIWLRHASLSDQLGTARTLPKHPLRLEATRPPWWKATQNEPQLDNDGRTRGPVPFRSAFSDGRGVGKILDPHGRGVNR